MPDSIPVVIPAGQTLSELPLLEGNGAPLNWFWNPFMLTPKEIATVLAALRHWQTFGGTTTPFANLPFFEEHEPLTVEEIDALCKSLEFSQAPSDEQQQKLVLALEACTLHLKQSKEATSATIEKVHNLLTLSVRSE